MEYANAHDPFAIAMTKEEREKENIFSLMRSKKLFELPVVVNECDHIRKLLNKNRMGKVPSKAAKC